jgi:putative ABC transport system ATP-binding protein
MTNPAVGGRLSIADDGGAMLLNRISMQVSRVRRWRWSHLNRWRGGAGEAFARLNWPESGKVASGAITSGSPKR